MTIGVIQKMKLLLLHNGQISPQPRRGGEVVKKHLLFIVAMLTVFLLVSCFLKDKNTPPEITIVSGPEGMTFESSSTFSWTGHDPDGEIVKYEYREDEGTWTDHGLGTDYTWNDYAFGEHVFEVRARDNGGKHSNILRWDFEYVDLPPDIAWAKCFGGRDFEHGFEVQQTDDGGYIIAAQTQTTADDGDVTGNKGGYDVWIVKLDGSGNLVWQKCLGGSSGDYARSIQQTSDGGYIVAGMTYSNDKDVNGNHGEADAWIVKLDSLGNIQWQKCLGGSKNDYAYSIQQTRDGGYIFAGETWSNDGNVSGMKGLYDAWIVKLNSLGDLIWQKCLGGTAGDKATSIRETDDGGFIVVGQTWSNDGDFSGNHGESDAWVAKLNPSGILQWLKRFGGSHDDAALSVQQTIDGGYIVAGGSVSNDGDVSGNSGETDLWVFKLDSLGNMQWQRCYGGSNHDYGNCIQNTDDGGYIIVGGTMSNDVDVSGNHGDYDFWIVKLDSAGNLQWQKCLGGSGIDLGRSIRQTDDGGYVIAGSTESDDHDVTGNKGASDVWLVKLE